MKFLKDKYALVIMLVMLACHSLYAQTDPLVGSWQIDVDKSVTLITGVMKDRYDSLDANGQARVVNAMRVRVFIFKQDGTFEATWQAGGQARESSGTWQAQPGLVTVNIDGNVSEFDYHLEEEELRLSNRAVTGFFTTLCFTRQ